MLLGYGGIILKGAFYTIAVGFVSVVIASVIGIFVALAKLSGRKGLGGAAEFYTIVIRGIPDLVMMLLIFYGIQIILNNITEFIGLGFSIQLSPFLSGVLAIGVIFGAYMAETFRGAILAIDRGELEAAHAFGFRGRIIFFRIIFPQIVRYGLSSFTNNWLVLLKTTSLVSVIGLNDMVGMAALASTSTQKPFLFYTVVLGIFLFLTSVSLWGLRFVQRRYHFE